MDFLRNEPTQAKRDLSALDETELLRLQSETARRSNLAQLAGNIEEALRLGQKCRDIQVILIQKALFSL